MFAVAAKFNNGQLTSEGSKPLVFGGALAGDQSAMFAACAEFNQQVTFSNMAAVTSLGNMFFGCTKFNNGQLRVGITKIL